MSSIFKLSAFITHRRSYPHMICHWPQILKSRKYVTMDPENIWSHHRFPKLTLRVCYVKRGRGLAMYIFSQESRCRVTSDCSDGKYNVLRSANAKLACAQTLYPHYMRYLGRLHRRLTLNIISFLLFSLVCVSGETRNLHRVFLGIYNDTKGESLCQAFPAETVACEQAFGRAGWGEGKAKRPVDKHLACVAVWVRD